jgi:hypothetical protein
MITPLQKVLLLRPVTYLLRGKPVATDHIVAGDGMTLEADDAVERVLVKVDGKTVYRVAYANVAGDVPADPFGIAKDGPTTLSGERVQSSGPITKDTLIAAAVMAAEHGNRSEQADPAGVGQPERPLSRAERRAQKKG